MEFLKQRDLIASEGAALDATDQAKLDVHNLKIEEANKAGTAFNTANELAKARQVKFNTEVDRYNKDCGSLAVKANDKAAVMKEREKK